MVRKLRVDARESPRPVHEPGYSGRRMVLAGLLVLLMLMSALIVAFRDWRTSYRARVFYGANQVAPAVDPLEKVIPPGVDPTVWRLAVADTHRALVGITAANLLTWKQMGALRERIQRRVARARPETARAELTQLWDDLAACAAPALHPARHPRPKILSGRPEQPRDKAGSATQ
jgi:hypothetical protein